MPALSTRVEYRVEYRRPCSAIFLR